MGRRAGSQRGRGARGAGLVEYALLLAALIVPLAAAVGGLEDDQRAELGDRGARIGNPDGQDLTVVAPSTTVPPATTSTSTSTTTTVASWTTVATTTTTSPPPPSTTTTVASSTTVATTTTSIPAGDRVGVASLVGSSSRNGSSKWTAAVVVTVRDGLGRPVGGATVTGDWSADVGQDDPTCTTDSSGTCVVTQWNLRQSDDNPVNDTTFTLGSVSHRILVYDPGLNQVNQVTVYKP